jgi:thioredoxin 1
MLVTEVKTEAGFAKALDTSQLVVVDFYATWCQPCKMLHKHLDDLSRANPSVKFYRVDVDAMPQVCSKYAVAKLPTLVFFRRSIPVDRVEGLDVDRLNRTLKKHL